MELQLEIEALIWASEQPLATVEIATQLALEPSAIDLEQALEAIVKKYKNGPYPFEVKASGGGYQFLTRPKYHERIAGLQGDRYQRRLSSTALETLSIIAYKQPVTKGEIEYIRGVNSDYTVQKLLEKELIQISGRNEDAVGKPLLYTTTRQLFDYLGISDVSQLPRLQELQLQQLDIPPNASLALLQEASRELKLNQNASENESI